MPTNVDRAELDGAYEREKDKSKSKSATKSKDLSHVPCKFFKLGSCTAGSSCPFSHSVLEPGQHKDVCAWFVKGNCKFGHKCALAHILPGQPMSMDRKNKKAAQASNSSSKDKDPSRPKPKSHSERRGDRPLLSGSTAPTRILPGSGPSRAPMPLALKATISPSAPAPPLQDSDFAALGLPDETTKLPSAPATRKLAPPAADDSSASSAPGPPRSFAEQNVVNIPAQPSPSPLPASTPSQPVRINDSTTVAELGPVGSPRSVSSRELAGRVNDFSPGTSPSKGAGFLSSSPFSAPGSQSVFFNDQNDFTTRSGVAASLGTTRTWAEYGRLPAGGAKDGAGDEVVVESEDLDFIPGSLSDLLTPEERSRRYSRSNASQSAGLPGPGMASPREGGWSSSSPRTNADAVHHRYSRSVPAPTLVGDIKSIWSDNGRSPIPVGSPRSSGIERTVTTGQAPGLGAPSSFKSTSGFGPRSFADDQISAFLSPSNASAAFLPGATQNYLSAKNMQRANSNSSTGSGNSGFRTGAYSGPGANAANLLARINEPAQPHSSGYARTQFDGTSESYGGQPFQLGGRPSVVESDSRHGMSPSALALQQHAPGQSLPQGLAAGYSRIHALPPPPVIPSPSASSVLASSQGAFAPGTSFQQNQASFTDWIGLSPGKPSVHDHVRSGLSFDPSQRVPYTSATTSPNRPGGVPSPAVRTPSGKSWVAPTSPLSRPILTGDDEDLFVLDH